MAKIIPENNATKKDVIAQKAAELFRDKGYSSASMRELANALGVEAPSLYNHIGSKDELLQIICFRVADTFIDNLTSIEKSKESQILKLETVIRFHIRMMLNNFNEVYVADNEWRQLKEPSLSSFLNKRRAYEKRLVQIIEAGIRIGEFKKMDSYISVLTILSAIRGLEFWQNQKKNISNQALEDEMINHLLRGILN